MPLKENSDKEYWDDLPELDLWERLLVVGIIFMYWDLDVVLSSESGAGGEGNIFFKNDKLSVIISEIATRKFWNFWRCMNEVFLVNLGSLLESLATLELGVDVWVAVVVFTFSSTYSIDTLSSSSSSSFWLDSNSSESDFKLVCSNYLWCLCFLWLWCFFSAIA